MSTEIDVLFSLGPKRFAALLVACCLQLTGCAKILGIDGDYEQVALEAGVPDTINGASGGEAGSGGTSGSASGGQISAGGGQSGAGGTISQDCSLDGSTCAVGQKCCFNTCVTPAPIVGCSLDGCDPCPAPPQYGVAICGTDNQCTVRCNDGFVYTGESCMPDGSSGGGGTAGSGGTGGVACDPALCTGCSLGGPAGCCKNDGTCGCSWAGPAYCL